MTDKTAPESQLRLEWVYGYRGNQCRNNLYYTDAENVVYFVAGVGVVYNEQDKSQQFFLGHTDDIISLALHPEKRLVATGQIGKDPFICVWDSRTLKTVSILQGEHQRGITALSFSGDGNFLASVGLDDYHTVVVWEWKKGRKLATARGHTDKVLDIQFNPYTSGVLVTCGVKHIKFWTHRGNMLTGKKGIFGSAGELQSVLCASFASAEVTYAGTFSGEIYKWNENRLQTVIRAHSSAIYCMHHSTDGYATGSRDGTVKLWDNNFKPITVINLTKTSAGYPGLCVRSVCWEGRQVLVGTKSSEILEVSTENRDNPRTLVQGHAEGELWALAVHPSAAIFASGSDDQTIRLWDRKQHVVLRRVSTPHAIRSLAFSTDGTHLAAGMQDGSFTVYDSGTLAEVTHVKDRKEVRHEMKYSPDGQYLAVGSNDNFVDIYSVKDHYRHICHCRGSSSFITHLDWSTDSHYIQTNSGAAERLFYKIPSGKQLTSKDEIQAIQWDTWTCVLGPETAGTWPKYSQTNDINATSASFQHQTIVTGDDFGLVKLFRFPSLRKGAKFRKYVGHSAHVTNVRFTNDDHHVISLGGADHAIFQWRFLPQGVELPKTTNESQTDEQPLETAGDSDSEESDSDVSDVGSVDSDLAKEQEMTYKRPIYREDLPELRKKLKAKANIEQTSAGLSANRAMATGKKQAAPECSLTMQFVHGYRGYDCRNNLYYTHTGEIVYHIAAVGVVYNSANHTQRFYTRHTDDILCLDMHPSKDFVATGQIGRDPAIHVWDAETMETLSILKGAHSRGVCAVDFSGDGKKLASVGLDDDHCIVVWDWRKGSKLAETRGHKDKIFMLQWNPAVPDHMITVGVKHIKFWTQAGGGFTSKRGVFGKHGPSTTMLCVVFDKEQDKAHSGGANGLVYHWTGNQLTGTVSGHQGPVYAMLAVEKGFITGGKDGKVALWDELFGHCLKTYQLHSSAVETGGGAQMHTDLPAVRALSLGQNKILVGTKTSEILEVDKNGPIRLLIQGHMEGELWGLAMHPSQLMCITVSDDCNLCVWDLSTNRMVASVVLLKPARCCCYSDDGKAIAVGMKDGSFVVLDTESLEEIMGYAHRKEEISDIKFSPGPSCKYLAVASHENYVDIYNVASYKRVGICKGASSYITHIDWDTRGKLLRINTGDGEVLYYEAPRGRQQYVTAEAAADIEWASWTCVLGKEFQGVWPPASDITDVNAAHVIQDGSTVATGDDFGFVKLFSFPSKGRHAKFKEYVGHSAHVTNVRWAHDSSRLVSIGGADMSMIVWTREGAADEVSVNVDDDDTDSEEEGYDSDVEREKCINYVSKTYVSPVRDSSVIKPHLKQQPDTVKKPIVSRSSKAVSLIKTTPAAKPIQGLALEFIFGYRGFDTRQNVFFTADGEVVFHAAGAGIIYNPLTRRQSFYLEHNDDIICLALSKNPKLKHVCATGQIGKNAPVHIWDLSNKQTLSILQGHHSIGVCSVNFSCSGKLVLTVGLDNSLAVWRWTEGIKMASTGSGSRRIFLAQFRPDSDVQLVSVGVSHIKFWTLAGSQLIGKDPIFPKSISAKMQTMLSMAFAPEGITYTGSVGGTIYMWAGNVLSRVVTDAHTGPVFAMYTSLDDGLIVSGGKETSGTDSVVKLWDQELKRCNSFPLPKADIIRSVTRAKGKIAIGTQDSRVLVLTEKGSTCEVLVQGHKEGELWGLAVHPSTNLFVTASDDKTVRTWSLDTKELKCEHNLNYPGRSVDFSPNGEMIAVGQTNGEFLLLSATDLSVLAQRRDRNNTIQSIRFSPSGDRLAVGSDDSCVDIYSVSNLTKGITRTSYCRGIPSGVTHMDWSTSREYLQDDVDQFVIAMIPFVMHNFEPSISHRFRLGTSMVSHKAYNFEGRLHPSAISTSSYEKLIYDSRSGRQVPHSSQLSNMTWDTWTSILGPEVIGIWPRNADKADVNTACTAHGGNVIATGDDFGVVKLFDHFPVSEKFAASKSYYGHSAHVTSVKFTHNDEYLLSAGGDDSCVFVWRTE